MANCNLLAEGPITNMPDHLDIRANRDKTTIRCDLIVENAHRRVTVHITMGKSPGLMRWKLTVEPQTTRLALRLYDEIHIDCTALAI